MKASAPILILAALMVLTLIGCAGQTGTAGNSQPGAAETAPMDSSIAHAPFAGITTERPITLPPGFSISVIASGLQSPRMMAFGSDHALYIAERAAQRVVRLIPSEQPGKLWSVQPVADGLNGVNGLAFFRDGSLFASTVTQIIRLSQPDAKGIFARREVVIDNLPSGGHNTRTPLFSPDFSRLFVSVGSSCNVCDEQDPRRAAISLYNPDGTGGRVYARGLRNAVGITFRPGTDELWATNNGRDGMGDDTPPEAVYMVSDSKDYGWPRCHAGSIVDPQFGSSDACANVEKPMVQMQAHSAPLGLAFYDGSAFPPEYRGDLFVAFHGSWNRSVPTGHKLVRIHFSNGRPGPAQDFATGWLVDGRAWGRPVDIRVGPDGGLYLSDDTGGYVYRIAYGTTP